jgi:hypothetical protein
MHKPTSPAAYLRAGTGPARLAMSNAAFGRGWPEPVVYPDDPAAADADSALRELAAALVVGRHDALLLAVPEPDEPAMQHLLAICTRHGVRVSFVTPPTQSGRPIRPARRPARARHALPGEERSTLTGARLDALAGLFPQWRIWLDGTGWHARRRGGGHLQFFRPGAPAFHVRADTATELAAQVCWQQAADQHAP